MVRDFHFGGGLFERKKEGAGGDGEGGDEEGEDGRQQKKSKKEVGAPLCCGYAATCTGIRILFDRWLSIRFLAVWRPDYLTGRLYRSNELPPTAA
jgi:hypothetical protein